MITDRIQLAGLDAYFQDPDNAGKINLGGIPATIKTSALKKGKQLEISGIQLLLEHADLQPLLAFQFDDQNQPAPLLKISVVKEMFTGLFADPFSHRVHNIAGFLDFNEGTITNGRVMEIDGIPTIVSTGRQEECAWVSREYIMPEPIEINAIAWELATTKLTAPDSFHYSIKIFNCKGEHGASLPDIVIGSSQMLKADANRFVEGLTNDGIKKFQVSFTAKVFEDSYINERHLPMVNVNHNDIKFSENMGRPLLRAINILEPVPSVYKVYSLMELQNICSDFNLFENPGLEIKRLTATIDINAVLVNSDNADDKYEYLQLELFANDFTRFEAKQLVEELIKVK